MRIWTWRLVQIWQAITVHHFVDRIRILLTNAKHENAVSLRLEAGPLLNRFENSCKSFEDLIICARDEALDCLSIAEN
jgi:hypothetical protein